MKDTLQTLWPLKTRTFSKEKLFCFKCVGKNSYKKIMYTLMNAMFIELKILSLNSPKFHITRLNPLNYNKYYNTLFELRVPRSHEANSK